MAITVIVVQPELSHTNRYGIPSILGFFVVILYHAFNLVLLIVIMADSLHFSAPTLYHYVFMGGASDMAGPSLDSERSLTILYSRTFLNLPSIIEWGFPALMPIHLSVQL